MIALVFMFPFVIYDFLTSVGGADALLGTAIGEARAEQDDSLVLYLALLFLPWSLGLATVTFNFYTYDIWKSENSFILMKILWCVLLIFDYVTTALGIINIMLFRSFFSISYISFFASAQHLGYERFTGALLLSLIVVMAPMAMNRLYQFSRERSARLTDADLAKARRETPNE
jgi:hypothetical protein